MRTLDRARLLESPDHTILAKPWEFDVVGISSTWEQGNGSLQLIVVLSHPEHQPAALRFQGVVRLRIEDGSTPLLGFKILDASHFLPEVLAPICVLQYQWRRSEEEPYFWAQSVEFI